MTAASYGHLDICRLLIDKGAQVEAKDRNGWTPLHWAAHQGHVETVRLLCDRGADVEVRDYRGWRPLHQAVQSGCISIMKELIEERNTEINAKNNDKHTALRLARLYSKNEIAAYLVLHGGLV